MKTIKILATLIIVAFTITTSSAQSGESKKLIVNKWIFDKEAMKPIITKMINEHPQLADADEATKLNSLNASLDEMSGLKVEYKADGAMLKTDSNEEISGTWTLSNDGKELITKTVGNPDSKYTVLEISKSKLSLIKSSDGINIILKPE